MSDNPPPASDSLRIERVLPAPIQRVFAALTEPASMGSWMSPLGHAEVEADLRVDGRFRLVMIDGNVRIEHTGEYLVVEPPRLLTFTWRSPYTGAEPSLVTVALTERGQETELVLVHQRLPMDQVTPHAGGWSSMIDRLGALLTDA